ncbi:hypothetical protein [Microbacterium sp.]|uniref:hypothetical protein n=1 Tax=Microbacterium sp. TaxID=51671 RepID=UPI003F70654D
MTGAERDAQLAAEAARWRRRFRATQAVLEEYQLEELRRRVAGVIDFELFERLIGRENVVTAEGRIDDHELAVRIRAELEKHPELDLRVGARVS